MIGILNIGLGNVQSVYNAIYESGFDPIFVESANTINDLTHLIMPGVGNFSAVMQQLDQGNYIEPIVEFANNKQPLLGICLGMQLLTTSSNEGGQCQGLNLIPASVDKIPAEENQRVPHVGWNTVSCQFEHPVFDNIKDNRDFYFVHSYHATCHNKKHSLAVTDYANSLTCAIARDNISGVQFHPEKSQKNGMQLLENFCDWDGQC
jgi:glutamine amidotransferase